MPITSGSVPPIPENAFFEQAVFDQDLSQGLLELARLSPELLDLVRGRLTRRVAGEPFLARLQELLRPTVVEVLIDPFLAAQLSNAVLAAQTFQHNADLLFSGMMPACGSANIPDCLFSAVRYALARLSHRCSSTGYDEPAILSYAISSFCPTSADGLHSMHDPQLGVPAQFPSTRRVANGDIVFAEISAAFWDHSGQVLRSFAVGEEPPPLYRALHAAADAAFDAVAAVPQPRATPAPVIQSGRL